ncbi:MAG: YIP1 family protein [Sphingobium sp.]|nr:YIP1 family protein [Sphingobium sp.]
MTTQDMNNTPPEPVGAGLVDRVKNIILRPKESWPVIDREATSISGLYASYAVILAAIPAIAMFLRGATIGYGAFGFNWKPGIMGALSMAVSQFVMAMISVAVLAFVTDFIVTKFDGKANRLNAFKLAVYSSTAAWLAGIFGAIPGLAFLGLAGLYSFYLLYTGLPVLMKVPQAKAATCTIVIAITALVLGLVTGAITNQISGMFVSSSSSISGGTVTVPGLGSIDTDKLEEASRKMEEISKNPEDMKPVDVARLKELLPASINGAARTAVESQSMAAGGISGGQASAVYEVNGHQIDVQITDLGAMGAMAGLGAALNVNQERETETGFERTRTENGNIIQEEWDNESKSGSYSVTVAGRFTLQVEGSADTLDALKAVADSIDQRKLAALAK